MLYYPYIQFSACCIPTFRYRSRGLLTSRSYQQWVLQRVSFTRGERRPNKAPLSSEWKHDSFLFLVAIFSHAKWNTDFCVSAVLLYWRNAETIMHRTSLCMLNPKKCALFHLLVSVVYRWIWEPDLSLPYTPPLRSDLLGSAQLCSRFMGKKCYAKNVIQKMLYKNVVADVLVAKNVMHACQSLHATCMLVWHTMVIERIVAAYVMGH